MGDLEKADVILGIPPARTKNGLLAVPRTRTGDAVQILGLSAWPNHKAKIRLVYRYIDNCVEGLLYRYYRKSV